MTSKVSGLKLVMGACDWHTQGPEFNPEHCKTATRTTKQKRKKEYVLVR